MVDIVIIMIDQITWIGYRVLVWLIVKVVTFIKTVSHISIFEVFIIVDISVTIVMINKATVVNIAIVVTNVIITKLFFNKLFILIAIFPMLL